MIEHEKEVEARVEAQAECDSTNDTSPDVVPDVTTIIDSDLQVTILAKLCANFATKEKNAVGYHVQRLEKKLTVKCHLCDMVISLGPFAKKIHALEKYAEISKAHKLNLALLRGDSEVEEQNIQETLDKTYPGVFAVASGKAKCKVCVESFNLNRKNFFSNMDRHVDSKDHKGKKSKMLSRPAHKAITSFFSSTSKEKQSSTQASQSTARSSMRI